MSINKDKGDNAVEVDRLTVRFGEFTAVNNVSFQVKQGEVFGFLGANGAGKTTTIRVLCGLLVPTSGSATVGGITFENGREAIKAKVGYMSQKFTLYDDLTVLENLDFIASLRKLNESVYQKRRKELFEFISFHKSTNSLVKDLPGGMKQQVSLAASMLHDPEIVFLDEPTAGVSSASRDRFWELIRQLAERGKTIFVTSHYMDEVERCDRIALMRAGEVIALDSPNNLKDKAFPTPLFELTPLQEFALEEINAIKEGGTFETLETYGLRYHVTIQDQKKWSRFQTDYKNKLEIRQIRPSLEDVFIRLVEGNKR